MLNINANFEIGLHFLNILILLKTKSCKAVHVAYNSICTVLVECIRIVNSRVRRVKPCVPLVIIRAALFCRVSGSVLDVENCHLVSEFTGVGKVFILSIYVCNFWKNVIVYLFVAVTCDTQGSQVSRAFLFLFTNRNSISNIHQFQLQDL